MSFQTPISIREAIQNVSSGRYLLPAIQREFVWSHEKIEWLFDSIMRDYPVSSFLFWRVEGATKSGYKFYEFLAEYRERYKTHNVEKPTDGIPDFYAVLDGQQRLTSLYIGLSGSYGYKEYKKHWEDNELAIPTRVLYLNIEDLLSEQEDGRMYEFKFLKVEDTKKADIYSGKWFRVGKILSLSGIYEFNSFINENAIPEKSQKILSKLHESIHSKPLINFFLESEQNIDKALNIFIRINSGGEPLDFSDLILSIAIASWKGKDARKEIFGLVDNVRDKGFTITKDFILRAFLYLHSSSIKFKVTNFSTENALRFEQEWENIRNAILSVFDLVKSFGFIDSTLRSKNALLPILYYLYHRGIYENFATKVGFSDDREIIRKWLLSVTVKRLFGGTSEGFLNQIRKAFTDNITSCFMNSGIEEFPVEKIKESVKSDMSVSDDFIQDLLYTQKDDDYAFGILALLYPHLDYKNNDFHKDHLHPKDFFEKKKYSNFNISADDLWYFTDQKSYNSILNLQMLDANENSSKNAKPLKDWLEMKGAQMKPFMEKQLIPYVDLSVENFPEFIEARNDILISRLKALLG